MINAQRGKGVFGGVQVEDVLDCKIVFKLLDDDGFGHRSILCRRGRIFSPLDAFQGFDLSAEQKVERHTERLTEADQN